MFDFKDENEKMTAIKILDEIKADMEKLIADKLKKAQGIEGVEGEEEGAEVVGMEIEAKPITGEEASNKVKDMLGGMAGGDMEDEDEEEDEAVLPRWKKREMMKG